LRCRWRLLCPSRKGKGGRVSTSGGGRQAVSKNHSRPSTDRGGKKGRYLSKKKSEIDHGIRRREKQPRVAQTRRRGGGTYLGRPDPRRRRRRSKKDGRRRRGRRSFPGGKKSRTSLDERKSHSRQNTSLNSRMSEAKEKKGPDVCRGGERGQRRSPE